MADLKKRTILQLRLDWSEMDLFGHINNVSYFKYIQAGRVNFWEEMKLMDGLFTAKTGPLLASTHCDFKKPLFYPGEIRIATHVSFIGNSSFGLTHQIFNNANELAALGNDVVVLYNFEKNKKLSLSEQQRQYLENYLHPGK